MTTKAKLTAGLLAAIPLFGLGLAAAPAQAQQYASRADNGYTPVIRGFNVDEVRRLQPGVDLNFDVYGTPGARTTISIGGASRNLHLVETEPGQYEGSYTISSRDRITVNSTVTANMRVGNKVTTGLLAESIVRGPRSGRNERVGRDERSGRDYRRGDLATVPRIERFDVQPNYDLTPGNELVFSVYGTPGAKVDMTIAGTRGVFFLPEVKPGEYSGEYTIRRADRIAPNTVVTANLRANGRVATATLNKPLQLSTRPQSAAQVVRYCTNCATVEAINVVEVNGDGSYLGTVGGGVVGALLGSQVGDGNGRTAAQIAGAIGGAVAGRAIERNAKRGQHYEVVIRFPNGGTQTVPYQNDPGFRVGEKVKLNNGVLARD